MIRRAREIPVPETIVPLEAGGGATPMHPTLPVIRNGFRQNRKDQSPRLVYAALQNGYKFLNLFEEAKTPGSKAHESVVAFLEKWTADAWAAAAAAARAAEWERRRKARASRKLLERRPVADLPGGTFSDARVPYYFYEYVPVSRPKPLSELRASIDGRRRVPRLATDAVGIPFLRLGKPQPWMLSVMIHVKRSKRLRRMGLASRMLREDLAFAAEEDRWEAVVTTQLQRQQRQQQHQNQYPDDYPAAEESTYAGTVSIGIQYLWARLNTESADMALRAKAMLELVNAEQALADQEEEEFRKNEAAEAARTAAGDVATTADTKTDDSPPAS